MRVRIPLFSLSKKKKYNLELNLRVLKYLSPNNQLLLSNPGLLNFLRVLDVGLLKTHTSTLKLPTLRSNPTRLAKPKEFSQYSQVFTQWINLNQISPSSLRKPYNPKQLSYLLQAPHSLAYVNVKSTLAMWVNLLHLLKHLFFYESKGLFLANPLLLKESTFLNWESLNCTWPFFKKFLPLFFSVNKSFNFKSLNVFNTSLNDRADFIFITDNNYHKVNALLFQKLNSFLITLHGEYETPWGNSFNLVNTSKSLLTQYFFLKCCFWLKKTALQEKILS